MIWDVKFMIQQSCILLAVYTLKLIDQLLYTNVASTLQTPQEASNE